MEKAPEKENTIPRLYAGAPSVSGERRVVFAPWALLEPAEGHANAEAVEAVREAGLRFAARQIRQLLDCGAPGIHLYSLNKSEMCLRLVEEAGL